MIGAIESNAGGSYGDVKLAQLEKGPKGGKGVQGFAPTGSDGTSIIDQNTNDEQPPAVNTGLVADTTNIGGLSNFPYLTPDAMMIYCQTRLTSIDSQCNNIMSKQKKNGETQAALSDLLTKLNQFGDGTLDKANRDSMASAYDKAIAEVGADTQLGQKLTTDKATLFIADDNKVNKEEMASLISSAKSAQSNLNSDSELDMIKLQSLMSQRQTAVQLTTNIVQALNDQANKIVANIGH